MYDNLVGAVKQAAIDAVNAQKPTTIRFGTVISTNPITIRLNNKLTVSGEFLCVLENYAKKAKNDDVVVLLSMQGGQKYIVLDRMVMI